MGMRSSPHRQQCAPGRWLAVTYFVFLSAAVCAQDFKRQYRQAKDLFASAQYSAAMDAFKPLTVYDRNNPYPEYAGFYYALSAYRLGFATLAKAQFVQLRKTYPTWEQMDEVNYWLVKIFLDQREYFHALQLARDIKDASLQGDLAEMKRQALVAIDDVETLKMLREDNPGDRAVDYALARALGRHPGIADGLLDSLTQQYGWNKKDFLVSTASQPLFREQYRIALLFPFLSRTLDAGPGKKKNQVVLDLYEGMKLAADSLRKAGVDLQLLAYDTDHEEDTIKKLLRLPELKSADLLVGPLFPEDTKWVQAFSQANHMNLVANPVSNNAEILEKNPYAFLFQPSYVTLGERAAEMLSATVKNKNCFVFFGNNRRDSLKAFSFKRRAKELGLKIPVMRQVSPEASGEILEILSTATQYDEWRNPKQFKLRLDSIGSVFVASDDPLIYTKVINGVEVRSDSILVVGQESWVEDNSVDFAKFERIKVAFSSANFSSLHGRPYLRFQDQYLQAHGTLPGIYAQKGYEFLMVVGQALKKFGVHFQEGAMKEQVPGALTAGFQLLPTRDNGMVPFVSFKEGQLEPFWKP